MTEGGEPVDLTAPPSRGVKLFLGGLSWETDEEKLRAHFDKYGSIEEVVVMRDAVTKKPRGFGFITFTEAGAADAVCRDTHTIDNRQIDAKHSVPQEQKPKSKKIFVGGLAPDTQEDQFKQHFEQFGQIVDAQIMQDHLSGRSRGFGFVTFEDDSAVEKVFALGNMHELAGKRVEIKTATPRGSGSFSRTSSLPGRGLARPGTAGRAFDSETGDPSQGSYGFYGFGYQGMMPGYQVGYHPMYGYGNMYPGYGFGYSQMHPAAFQLQGVGYDPRTAMQFQAGRGYTMGGRPSVGLLPQRSQQQ